MQDLLNASDILDHLQEVSGLRTPLRARPEKSNNECGALLMILNGSEPKLAIKTTCEEAIQDNVITLDYAISGKAFAFRSEILSWHRAHSELFILQLAWPDKIQCTERRLYLRAKLSPQSTFFFDLQPSGKPPLRLQAENVSGGGIGFFAPQGIAEFSPGHVYHVSLHLNDAPLQTRMLVRSSLSVLNMVRVGVEFMDLNARQRLDLIEYAIESKASCIAPVVENTGGIKHDILVATNRGGGWPVAGIEKIIPIRKTEMIDALTQVNACNPELIIVDLDTPGAANFLKELTSAGALNVPPLVLASAKKAYRIQNRLDMRFIQLPIQAESLSKMIVHLIQSHHNALIWQAQLNSIS